MRELCENQQKSLLKIVRFLGQFFKIYTFHFIFTKNA